MKTYMPKLVLILLLIFIKNQSSAQSNYQDYLMKEKRILLSETFDNNSNNWITDNNWFSAQFSDGCYSMKCKNFKNSTGLSYIETMLDTMNDFEIEANLKVVKGSGALIFGMADNLHHLRIEVNNSKQVLVLQNLTTKGKIDKLFNDKVEAFKPNEYNKITIRKVNKEYYLFINEVFVKKFEDIELFGKRIGFSVSLESEISADYLSLSYIKHSLPLFTWLNPLEEKSTVFSDKISLKGLITSESDIKTIQIVSTTNKINVPNDSIKKQETVNEYHFSYTIPLQLDINEFSVIVTNNGGSATSPTCFINYVIHDKTKEKRLALVIGNSEYPGGLKLKNPVNDAVLMEKTLRSLDFEVISQLNADKKSMESAVREFSTQLPNYNVALFYYAGHGIQIDGINYLIPVDAKLNNKTDCKYEAVEVNYVVEEFEQYSDNINIVILDACRNNPYRSWTRAYPPGFKAMDPGSGTIIAFATSEGSTAADGANENGLYTEELVKQMLVPQAIESVFKKTRVEVEKRSSFNQSPQEWSKLKGDFSFKK